MSRARGIQQVPRPKTHSVFYWSLTDHGEPIDTRKYHESAAFKTYRNFNTEFEARMFAAGFPEAKTEYRYCAMPAHGETLWRPPNLEIE